MILQTSTSSLEQILAAVGQAVTASVGWLTTFLTTITSNPILLIGLILSMVGFGVGLLRRLMNL